MIASFFSLLLVIVVVLAAVSVVALIGGILTEVGPWYESLNFPWLRPPNWLFAPAWTLIYCFIAAAAVVGWQAADADGRSLMLKLFAINAVLNVLWSPLFFKLKRPDWALYELVPFWLSVAALVVALFQISTAAGWLILPYLLWVTFAGWLNWRIVVLNQPFGAARSAAPTATGK